MIDNFSWIIPDKLAGCALPGGGYSAGQESVLSDLRDLYQRGVRCLVSLTDSAGAFGPLCQQAGLIWIFYPIPEFGIPRDQGSFNALMERLVDHLERGQPVCAHCYAGIGRTGLVLCCLAGRYLDLGPVEAIRQVRSLRPAIETREQELFVARHFLNQNS